MPPRRSRPAPPRFANTRTAPENRPARPEAVAIDAAAGVGQRGLAIGDRVTITGRGAHAGESGTIERFTGSVIPSAAIRTDSGQMHHVRTIDIDLSRREP